MQMPAARFGGLPWPSSIAYGQITVSRTRAIRFACNPMKLLTFLDGEKRLVS
jgi:hypothetical protein